MDVAQGIIPNQDKALFLAKRQLPEFVYDAVNLEGIHYTLPEVQTLLDGITVGGHKLSDQMITLNQAAAWRQLFELIEADQFALTKAIACELHNTAAKKEALEWGYFRTGGVTIAGTNYQPPAADELNRLWDKIVTNANKIKPIYDRAIYIFLQMARIQFFYDVNRRLGRFVMNGLLLANGYPAINLPAAKQLEFNKRMLEFYASNDVAPMTTFMESCLDAKVLEIMS